jgi:hypothetical protein
LQSDKSRRLTIKVSPILLEIWLGMLASTLGQSTTHQVYRTVNWHAFSYVKLPSHFFTHQVHAIYHVFLYLAFHNTTHPSLLANLWTSKEWGSVTGLVSLPPKLCALKIIIIIGGFFGTTIGQLAVRIQEWPCKNAEVTLYRKIYNFEPWTLAYVSTDPTASPRAPAHAMPSQILLTI